jgi:hypothetical protein
MAKKGSLTPTGRLVKRYVRIPARRLSAEMTDKLIRTRERQAQALDLKKAGATYEEIAKALGYSHRSSARQAVKAAIERIGIEPAKEVVEVDLMRLDEFQKRLTNAMRQGDLGVIPSLMAVMRERRALLGWTSETWAEEQRKGQGVVNNGVMVINGGQASFIEGMMHAIGIDPNSEEAKKHLARVRLEEEKAGNGEFAVPAARKNDAMMQRAAESAMNHPQIDNVVEAEIVEEDID